MNTPLDMGKVVRLRPSALPLAFHCPAAIRGSGILINETNTAAGAGSATHELLCHLVEDGTIEWDRINEISDKHGGADDQEVRMLCGKACKIWPQLLPFFPRAMTEVRIDKSIELYGLKIAGTMDLISISGDVARILDWKTGRLDSDYWQQIRAYGCMVLLEFPQLRECTVTIVWLRKGEFENYTLTQADAREWLRELEARVIDWDGVYCPETKYCSNCPRGHECEARNRLVRRDVAAIADLDIDSIEASIATMPADQIIALTRKAKTVARYGEAVVQAVKAAVMRGQAIEANGVELTVESEARRELDAQKTWSVLDQSFGFTDEDFADVVKMRVSAIETRVRKNAGKGNGAAAVRDLRNKLELAGAVEINEVFKLVERRV